ncbi:hypothetical protein HUS23_12855 [Ectothiorhodospiraceae bacterium 2226]|nr:hypothetical protein HUS23_12855 [Ectothiorhodospiraceae bacterium 2226]
MSCIQAVVGGALFIVPTLGSACSCLPDSVEGHYGAAAEVFVGRVVTVRDAAHPGPLFDAAAAVAATVAVEEAYKGYPASPSAVWSEPVHPGHCAIDLAVGGRYLFYVHVSGQVDLCGGTRRLLADDRDELADLRRLRNVLR